MNEFFSSFFIGLFYTVSLFAMCYVAVVGTRIIFRTIIQFLTPPKIEDGTPAKKRRKKTKPQPTPPKPIHSIEIDPDQIDRIFVKKSS